MANTKPRGAQQRGAAMVEAVVVIPTMLIFLGCTVFVHNAYMTKMDKQWGTRSGVMYYASHACEGEVPGSVVPAGGVDPVGPDDGTGNAGNNLGGESGAATRAGLDRSYNLVRAQPADTPVSGSAVLDTQTETKRVALSTKVSAFSEVGCNEKSFPSKWTAVFKYIGEFVQSGGGILD